MLEVVEVSCYQDKAVAIAGLGGLGSNIAVMLARSGVGNLLLIDYDRVEYSNLNRQYYLPCHVGRLKAEALTEQLLQINPALQLTVRVEKITAENAAELFTRWPLVCEALDDAAAKAMVINTLLKDKKKIIVSGSGMAGLGSANAIYTARKMARLYVCGDESSDMEQENMWAPRVQICAGHQANMVLRLLAGWQEP